MNTGDETIAGVKTFSSEIIGTISDISNHTTASLTENTNLYFTDARAQAAITGGTGVTLSSGEVSIGQSVGTTDDVTFKDVTVNGSLNSDLRLGETRRRV